MYMRIIYVYVHDGFEKRLEELFTRASESLRWMRRRAHGAQTLEAMLGGGRHLPKTVPFHLRGGPGVALPLFGVGAAGGGRPGGDE